MALAGGKSNSSAAWGTLSKPMKAHGAMATIAAMAATGFTPEGKAGVALDSTVCGLISTPTRMQATAISMITQAMNWMRPESAVPRMLSNANTTSTVIEMTTSTM